jgi:hypothetical protein
MPAPHRSQPAPATQPDIDCTAAATRQLNRAIHIIALGRMAWDPETRAYIQRRVSEGKTKREAIRCLKRHLARRIWRLLYLDTTPSTPVTKPIHGAAPGLMPCTR